MTKYLSALFLWSIIAGAALAQRDRTDAFTRDNPKFIAAFKTSVARPSVSTVRVHVDGKETALGMVVGPDGWILTKANDLHGSITVTVRGGQTFDAEIVGIHAVHDLALLKINARGLIPVEFKESKTADVGSWVACVGVGDEPVAIGVVSVASRNVAVKGPIVSSAPKAFLGVTWATAGGGIAKIGEVLGGTPADKAGLKSNDIILTLGGVKIDNQETVIQLLGKYKPGDIVKVTVRRGEGEFDQQITLGKREESRGETQNKMGSQLSSRTSGYPTILQHDSIVRPTDCGGPIVDLEGRVVGINICRAGRVESWAVPSEVIQPILLELMSGKLAPKKADLASPKLSPDEKLALAKAAVLRAERDKTRFEKDIDAARQLLKDAEAEVKAYRRKDSTDSADRLVQLMQKRLAVMNDVAGWKWNHRVEILDPVREKDSLDKLNARAKELGIDPKASERFFKAQFEASRLLQEDAIAGWQKNNVLAPIKGDLAKDLRPRIDQINDEIVQSLALVLRYWGDAELAVPERVRQQSLKTLAGPGINETIRSKAMDGIGVR